MNAFVAKHRSEINGVLECFDRVILRGHLPVAGVSYFLGWLCWQRISLKATGGRGGVVELQGRCPVVCREPGRPTLDNWPSKPAVPIATCPLLSGWKRTLASWPGMTASPRVWWCVGVRRHGDLPHFPRAVMATAVPSSSSGQRVCLVIYFYWMDREFGLMHVKIQTWFPFTVQVYLNGHEWLARKLTARGITFEKHDNAFVELADVEKANELRAGVLAA